MFTFSNQAHFKRSKLLLWVTWKSSYFLHQTFRLEAERKTVGLLLWFCTLLLFWPPFLSPLRSCGAVLIYLSYPHGSLTLGRHKYNWCHYLRTAASTFQAYSFMFVKVLINVALSERLFREIWSEGEKKGTSFGWRKKLSSYPVRHGLFIQALKNETSKTNINFLTLSILSCLIPLLKYSSKNKKIKLQRSTAVTFTFNHSVIAVVLEMFFSHSLQVKPISFRSVWMCSLELNFYFIFFQNSSLHCFSKAEIKKRLYLSNCVMTWLEWCPHFYTIASNSYFRCLKSDFKASCCENLNIC